MSLIVNLLQVSLSFGQMSTTRVREMAPLMEGQRVSFPWSSVLLGVCGAVGFVAVVFSTQSSTSFLMTSSVPTTTTASASTVRTAPLYYRPQQSQAQMAAVRAPFGTPATEVVEVPSAGMSPMQSPALMGVVAGVSAMVGALAMYLQGKRNSQRQIAPATLEAPAGAFHAGAPFTASDASRNGVSFMPQGYGHGRGQLALQAAKGGKGGKGGGKVAGYIKLALPAGKATAAPPVGPALGQYGLNIVQFCKEYNARTEAQAGEGLVIPVEITAFEDRSFTFILKTPPASVLLKKYAKIDKGSGNPSREKVGSVTKADVEEIAKIKLPDLNTNDVAMAMRIVEGTARGMGITVEA